MGHSKIDRHPFQLGLNMNTEKLKQKSVKLRLLIDSLKAQEPAAMKSSVELEPLLHAAEPWNGATSRVATCSLKKACSSMPISSMRLQSFALS